MRHIPLSPEKTKAILTMRDAGKTFQQIATALHHHPSTCRDVCLAAGMPICLPGSHAYGGKRADWKRKIDTRPVRRDPLPAGHQRTWGAISAQPWPGVVT